MRKMRAQSEINSCDLNRLADCIKLEICSQSLISTMLDVGQSTNAQTIDYVLLSQRKDRETYTHSIIESIFSKRSNGENNCMYQW